MKKCNNGSENWLTGFTPTLEEAAALQECLNEEDDFDYAAWLKAFRLSPEEEEAFQEMCIEWSEQ